MYIHHRPAAAIFRLAIGALSTIGAGLQFVTLGDAAWRLFSTWVMILTAIYYIVLSLISALCTRRSLGKQNSPMFEGVLITANSMILIGTLCFLNLGWPVPGANGLGGILIHFVIPLMTLLDYALFCRKGRLQFIYPFDWLVLPIVYVSLVLISALNYASTQPLAIPYPFLDYAALGFENFALSLIIIALLTLVFGYSLFLADFALSGKLAKRIVLPKLKAVPIEDEQATPVVTPTPRTQPVNTSPSSKSTPKPSAATKTSPQKPNSANKKKPKPASVKTTKSAAKAKKPKAQSAPKPAKPQSATAKSSEKPANAEPSNPKPQAAKPSEPKPKETPKIRKF